MTYKEALLFVGKCLTLGIHTDRVSMVLKEIRDRKIVWEQIVHLSSSQLVLPALYIRLERADLLKELPPDLVEYMLFITRCNRERNLQIIHQIKDITTLLNSNGIEPILLKGTAHLLLPLYEDIGERMIGDIDFLVSENDFLTTAQLLISAGYQPLYKFSPDLIKTAKHYPRLTNFNYPAAVEVHRQVIVPPYDKKFNSVEIIRDKQRVIGPSEVYIPSYKHLIIHNVLNTQVNDKAYLQGNLHMRQMYDLLLLSAHENPQKVLTEFNGFRSHTTAYLAITSMVFDKPARIAHNQNKRGWLALQRYNYFILNPAYHSAYKSTIYIFIRLTRYITLPFQSLYRKDVRAGLWYRLNEPKWYKNHLLSYWLYFKTNT